MNKMPSKKPPKEITEAEKLCKKLGVKPIITEKIKDNKGALEPVTEDGHPINDSEF